MKLSDFLVEKLISHPFESGLEVVGVMGLNQCQWRWWKHFSPQRKTENPTSTENTAPDMQKPLRLLTEAATDRQRRKSKRAPEVP